MKTAFAKNPLWAAAACACVLAACGGGSDETNRDFTPTQWGRLCGKTTAHPFVMAGRDSALLREQDRSAERRLPHYAAFWASALPGVRFGTADDTRLELGPFDAQNAQSGQNAQEAFQVQIQAQLSDGSAACITQTRNNLPANASLENYPAPRIHTAQALGGMYILEAFEFSWRNFPDASVQVRFDILPGKYALGDSATTPLQICQSRWVFMNRSHLECAPATVTPASSGPGWQAEATLQISGYQGTGDALFDVFLIAPTPRGFDSRYPWNP